MEVSVSKEREPASGPPREPVGRPEGLPKSSATGGDAGRPNARRQRSCGCCAARISKPDRKSTRLNSSHGYISYAVFCLKKKKKHKLEIYNTKRKDPCNTCNSVCTS